MLAGRPAALEKQVPRDATQDTRGATWTLSPSRSIALDRPRLIGILNLTPDSFSDGGSYPTPDHAVQAAAHMLEHGADAIDVGGESTRPGARAVPDAEQIARVTPFLRALRRSRGPVGRVPVTIDTTRAPVAAAALDAGADAINDISAGRDDPEMFALAAARRTGIVLMHRLRTPDRDAYSDRYARAPIQGDVLAEVGGFLRERTRAAVAAGVDPGGIVIDPGLGFGKSVEQNLELVRRTGELAALGRPVLSGASRKSFVGRVSLERDSTPAERLVGTLAISVAHLHAGARLFRVHDVREHAQALRTAWAILRARDGIKIPSELEDGP